MPENEFAPEERDTFEEELLDAYSSAVIRVVDKVGPAVVSIGVRSQKRGAQGDGEGAGSGVIIAPDGFILTNNHVIAGAKSIELRLTEGGTFPARVVGADPATDLAVVKVNENGLPSAEL